MITTGRSAVRAREAGAGPLKGTRNPPSANIGDRAARLQGGQRGPQHGRADAQARGQVVGVDRVGAELLEHPREQRVAHR